MEDKIMELESKLMDWSLAKQEEVKLRLWKEFDLSRFYDESIYQRVFEDKSKLLVSDSEYYYLLDIVKVREHFNVTLSHKSFVLKTFSRFQKYFESKGITIEQVSRHDDSKLTSFIEIVGYTHRWILNIETKEWDQAWVHHYTNNSYNPEYYITKEKVQKDMDFVNLVVSVMDLIAFRWEKIFCGNEEVTNKSLLVIEEQILKRYTLTDRLRISIIIDQLKKRPSYSCECAYTCYCVIM